MYIIETGGMRLLMWGDNRPEPTAEVKAQIGDIDVVFVPVDGSKHILDYEQADAVLEMTNAKIAIPHHYLVPETTYYTSTLLPATEWAETHEHTMLDAASVTKGGDLPFAVGGTNGGSAIMGTLRGFA